MSVFAKGATRKQSGAALIAFLLVFVIGASFAVLKDLNVAAAKQYSDAKTAEALAEAKAALIGYAAAANIMPGYSDTHSCDDQCPRPGDLPCPDMDNDGTADTPCSGADSPRIGRLPRKQLGLTDLRDGSGERLWYAVSTNFQNNFRTGCGTPTDTGCLHSETQGTITVINANGAIRHNGPSGAIAVVFAPGPALRRQDGGDQDRACTNCDAKDKCLSSPVPRCDPKNYLDVRSSPPLSEDNQDFEDSTTNGFIEGPVIDAQGNLIINDRLAVIKYEDLMPLLEKRVVGEVSNCLEAYAQANLNRYPWAAKLDTSQAPEYGDDGGPTPTRFGRVPDGFPVEGTPSVEWDNSNLAPNEKFTNTRFSSGGLLMAESWPLEKCLIVSTKSKNTWWLNWKESVFYGVAADFAPNNSPAPSACASSPACLTVEPTAAADAKFVVIAAGRSLAGVLGGQPRNDDTDKGNPNNYLEDNNASQLPVSPYTDNSFTAAPTTATFNDVVCKNGSCF